MELKLYSLPNVTSVSPRYGPPCYGPAQGPARLTLTLTLTLPYPNPNYSRYGPYTSDGLVVTLRGTGFVRTPDAPLVGTLSATSELLEWAAEVPLLGGELVGVTVTSRVKPDKGAHAIKLLLNGQQDALEPTGGAPSQLV